jgi:hypothetical protein
LRQRSCIERERRAVRHSVEIAKFRWLNAKKVFAFSCQNQAKYPGDWLNDRVVMDATGRFAHLTSFLFNQLPVLPASTIL